jgi:hypothetical protein
LFNPTIPQSEIDRLIEKNPTANRSEYLAEFRNDLEAYVSLEIVESCVGEFHELPPRRDTTHRCFVDSAGGSGADSFTAAISHRNGEQVVIDALREWQPPFSPDQVIGDIAALCKTCRISKAVGDKFSGGFAEEAFRRHGLQFEAAKPKAELYRDLLAMLNSGQARILLPKNQRLVNQLVSLERRVSFGDRTEAIDRPPGAHDDLTNAVAGAAQLAFSYGGYLTDYSWVDGNPGDNTDPHGIKAAERAQLHAYVNNQIFGNPWGPWR